MTKSLQRNIGKLKLSAWQEVVYFLLMENQTMRMRIVSDPRDRPATHAESCLARVHSHRGVVSAKLNFC